MAKPRLKVVTPATIKRTVTPRRPPNGDIRTREYLTEAEVEKLMNAATGNRHGHRDASMVLVAYRHGLRAAELVDLRWNQVDFRSAALHVRRVKQGTPSVHPIAARECHDNGYGNAYHWQRVICGRSGNPTRPAGTGRFRQLRLPGD